MAKNLTDLFRPLGSCFEQVLYRDLCPYLYPYFDLDVAGYLALRHQLEQ